MGYSLRTAVAAAALFAASPAFASVTIEDASLMQGVLVHGTGFEQVDTVVTGNLGAGGPNIVNFSGDTTQTVSTTDDLRLQDGQGQADVTGAEITVGGSPNDTYNILSGNIYLTQGGMEWIEFALTGLGNGGTVDFFITLNGTTEVSFLNQLLGNGDTFFAFLANGGDLITNVRYVTDNPPGELTTLKQVRIIPGDNVVPEPSTWAMMLLGFGVVGYSIRRRRKILLRQAA
jgi:PEP-CTERM motif